MHRELNDQTRHVMLRAEQEARARNHEYIGTEHLLLAIVDDAGPEMAHALVQLGLAAEPTRAAVDALVERGMQPTSLRKLPVTPRANQAIEFATQEAWNVHQDQIGPEHLLLGLAREPVGIAGQVLAKFNLKHEDARRHLLAFRIEQLKYVERIVRPVPAGSGCKRKMREELLTHLTAIYEEELARLNNPTSAWQSATERFGTPAEISRELRNSLPFREQLNDFIERRLGVGWRPPETGTHWMARCALQTLALLAVLNIVAAICMVTALGWNVGALMAIRSIVTMSLLVALLQFVLGTLYFKVRDATFGVFGSPKSPWRAFVLAALMGLISGLVCLSFVPFGYGGAIRLIDVALLSAVGLATTIFILLAVRQSGPIELRDTLWGCLDLDNPPADNRPTIEPA